MNNYRVYFVNENIEVQAAEDATLLEAQILAGLHPDAPCGGKGTCGKCLVEVRESGKGEWKQLLACQEKVHCDLEVRTAAPSGSVKILTQADAEDTAAWDPWIRVVRAELSSGCTQEQIKSIVEKAAGITEWAQGVEIAAYEGDAVWAIAAPDKILAVSYSEPNALMAAFDIGTTTIAGYLISLKQKKVAAVASMLNPQIQFGADVISRANYTLEHGVGELTENIRGALDGLIGQMCLQAKAARSDIYAVSAVGNTCMHHLLIGVELHTLVRAPYDPAVRGEMILSAREYGMDVHPCAQLLLQPVIAGFVGADTVACLVSGKWRERKPCTLLIDIGTNGEMVLGNADRRIACSTAAGPALEGAKIQCGMRGGEGAVDHVWLEDGRLKWHIIGEGEARGICGSGLVDLIAALLESEAVDETGRLQEGNIVSLGETGVVLTQKDIREVQLAKAAIAAGIQLMCRKMGISLKDIDEVHIAGAFGSYMNADSACRIGLIPSELREKIKIIGNAAGQGAQRVLTEQAAWDDAVWLAKTTEFLELASMPEFQDVFVDELEFPECE